MRRGFLNKPLKSDEKSPILSTSVAAADVEPVLRWTFLIPFRTRPTESDLAARLSPLFLLQNASSLVPTAVRAARETWNIYADGSVQPTDFLQAPPAAPYRVANIPGKGRGMRASRDMAAGETVLMETPLIILVENMMNSLSFLALPKPAIHALLLLHVHNAQNYNKLAQHADIPQHRLLDYLNGMVDANGTKAGLIVLAGSLFNHSDEPDVWRMFDVATFNEVFFTAPAVQKGEELTIRYNHTKEDLLENYGIVV